MISISPDKAGPPVTGWGIALLHKRSAEAGETLAGIRPVFRQKLTIKAGKQDTGDAKETMSLHMEMKNAMKRDNAGGFPE